MQAIIPEKDIFFLKDPKEFSTHQSIMMKSKGWLVYTLLSPHDHAIQSLTLIAQESNIPMYFINSLDDQTIQFGYSLLQEKCDQQQNKTYLLSHKQDYQYQILREQQQLKLDVTTLEQDFDQLSLDYQKRLAYLQKWQATVGNQQSSSSTQSLFSQDTLYQLTLEQKELFKQHIEKEELLNQSLQAIKTKFLIVTENYQVIGTNQSIDKTPSTCYQLLFNRSHPCQGCQLGQTFELSHPYYQVSSAKIQDKDTNQDFYINWYQLPIERKIHELNITSNSRLTQLGIISASMAHELNNPLAGILSFTQLLLMDKGVPTQWLSDLKLMEQASQRARILIEKLLIFSKFHHQTKDHYLSPHDFITLSYEIAKLDIFKQSYPDLKIHELNLSSSTNPEINNLLLMITEIILQKILAHADKTNIELYLNITATVIQLEFRHNWLPLAADLEKIDFINNLKWALNGQIQHREVEGQKSLIIQFRRPDF